MNTPQPPKTAADWWANAEFVLPALRDYAYMNGVEWDDVKAAELFSDRNHRALYMMFYQLWWDLPDAQFIRHGPFFALADLCSEYWVFSDDQETDDQKGSGSFNH